MTLLKRLERELLRDWEMLQKELIPEMKAEALKSYYIKFAAYRKTRIWSLELASGKAPLS